MGEIELLRKHIDSFIERKILPDVKSDDKVLEVGPTIADGNLRRFTLKTEIEKRNASYISVDIDRGIPADYYKDIVDLWDLHINKQTKIVCLDVFEHVRNVWEVPEVLYSMLVSKGLLYASTPLYFLRHDPKPDLWRFTEEGIEELFSGYFIIRYFDELTTPWADHAHAIHYNYILEKTV